MRMQIYAHVIIGLHDGKYYAEYLLKKKSWTYLS